MLLRGLRAKNLEVSVLAAIMASLPFEYVLFLVVFVVTSA